MLNARSSIIRQYVLVLKVSLEIHSLPVHRNHQNLCLRQFMMTSAIVFQTPCVRMKSAFVYQITMEMDMYLADQSVFSTVIAQATKPASETSVKTHVFLELVVKEPFVTSSIMPSHALALLEPLEVHLFNVNQFRMNQFTQTHVNHHLVDQTVNVVKSIIKLCVHVCQITSVVLQLVDQNALSTQIVRWINLVRIRNVRIHVLELVAKMQTVKF
uniref:Uncharacterized protein n=1 Tax=Cacopsylla melanoneura TaxID=428564 RepID=A0A8D9EVE4_9HEMI